MAGDSNPEGHQAGPRRDRGQIVWRVFLNAILVGAFVLAVIPIVAVIRGFIDLVAQSKLRSGGDWLAYGFAFTYPMEARVQVIVIGLAAPCC